MIKCNVTIIGRVFRAPEIKNDREGNPFVTFGVSTELKDNGETRDIDISVACDGEDDNVLGLSSGDRVKVKGVLIFRKREDVVFFNLSANEVNKTKERRRLPRTCSRTSGCISWTSPRSVRNALSPRRASMPKAPWS